VVDRGISDNRADGLVMGFDGAGDSVEDILNGSLADMQAQHREEKILEARREPA